jgi:hypothetical protein
MSRGVFRRYEQLTDEIVPVSHDTTPYLDARGVTLTTAAATDVDSGLSLTSEAQSTAGWSALVSAEWAGTYTFRLQLDYSDGSRQILEFQIAVVDA